MFMTTEAFQHCLIQTLLFKDKHKIDKLIVGLGNPGEEYEHTLHNAGFDAIDLIADEHNVNYWKEQCGALVAQIEINDKNVLLAKPQSYMNTSGGPVSLITKKYKIQPSNIIIIHDDLDIAPGTIRIKNGGSDGGHNGIKSIINKLGSSNFIHVKIGIGRPINKKSVIDWVLSKPVKTMTDDLCQGIETASKAALDLISSDTQKVQNKYNSHN